MIRLLFLLRSPTHMSREAFIVECETHRQMAASVQGIHRYHLTLVDSQPKESHVPLIELGSINAIGEVWVESEAELQRIKNSAACKRWMAHGETFIGGLHTFVMNKVSD